MQAKVCDFVANCPYGDDESLCPPFEVFDECNSLEECHWTEESPDDDLNFVIKSIGNINKNVFSNHQVALLSFLEILPSAFMTI